MFEFVNKIFQNKRLTEEEKISIIELVNNEESFINPREIIVEKSQPKKAARESCKSSLDQLCFTARKNE